MDSRCFSKDFVIEFLHLYRSQTCLWKIKSKDYSNRDKKQEAYQLLIDKLKEIDSKANKDMVVKKIDSFRGSFRKELKKIEEMKRAGVGEELTYKPKLWYFDYLTFLCDQMPGKNVSNVDEFTDEVPIKMELHHYSDENSLDDIVDEPSLISSVTLTPSLSGAEPSISTFATGFKDRSNKKRQVDTCDEEVLKKVCVHLEKPDSFNDEFSVMAANIANKLRKLPPETVGVVEKLITDILFEAQCGNVSQHTRINLVDSRKNFNFI